MGDFRKMWIRLLEKFIDSGKVVAYMDDIMVATSTIHQLAALQKFFRLFVLNKMETSVLTGASIDRCVFNHCEAPILLLTSGSEIYCWRWGIQSVSMVKIEIDGNLCFINIRSAAEKGL